MNQIQLIGRLTRDPETRTTAGGEPVANFSLAVNGYKKDDPATFFDCSVWGKRSEVIANYCKKGTQLFVQGRLSTRSYTSNKDGSTKFSLCVTVTDFEFSGSGKQDQSDDTSGGETTYQAKPSRTPTATERLNAGIPPKEDLPEIDVDQLNVQMPF